MHDFFFLLDLDSQYDFTVVYFKLVVKILFSFFFSMESWNIKKGAPKKIRSKTIELFPYRGYQLLGLVESTLFYECKRN